MELCVKCNERLISNKKHSMCSVCYKEYYQTLCPVCKICNERPTSSKKSTICAKCYGKNYRAEKNANKSEVDPYVVSATLKTIENEGEVNFIKNFFTHKNWIHHPATFHFNGSKYQPDFYDRERNVFIEVVGTRQAYHLNKDKYEEFRKYYSAINFELRRPSGEVLSETERMQWDEE
jgi:hypothetical protein